MTGKAKKQPAESVVLALPTKIQQAHGGALNSGGTPGNRGGPGRPPDALKAWCDELLFQPECRAQVEAIMKNKDHPAFSRMWAALADRAYGKPNQPVSGTLAHLTYEQILARTWD